MRRHVNHKQPRPSHLEAVNIVIARTAMEDCPLVGATRQELHHHDVVAAGVALVVEFTALTESADNEST